MKFSKASERELQTCDSRLQEIMNAAIEVTPLDFSIIQGARSVKEARENFANGTSQLDPDKGQYSKHIVGPEVGRNLALAVDIAPYYDGKVQWKDERYFYFLAGVIHAIAEQKGIQIRYGGAWNLYEGTGKLNSKDQFMDLGHFELLEK